MALNKVNLNTESFKVKEMKSGGVKIEGFALPFDKTSRNGFGYRKESIQRVAESLKGKPMFFNHNTEGLPIGKVTEVKTDAKGLHYKAELFPYTETEKAIVQKVQQGLLDSVSIQCIYENADMVEESDGSDFKVDIKEFLELSIVGVPGFADTTIQAHESLMNEQKMKNLKTKLKEELQVKADEESSTEEESTTDLSKMVSMLEEISDRLGIVESRLDAAEEEETTEEVEEEKDDKVEEEVETDTKKVKDDDEEVEERLTAEPKSPEKFDYRKSRAERLLNL